MKKVLAHDKLTVPSVDAQQVTDGQLKKLTLELLALSSQLKTSTETVEALRREVDERQQEVKSLMNERDRLYSMVEDLKS